VNMKVGILAALAALGAAGQSPSTAREIMQEVQRRSFSKSFRYDGHITVRKASGVTDRKTWRYERFGPPGDSKVMLRFLDPAEIRGVALLVWNSPGKAADMWLYTPSLERTRRIARQDRASRFAGTGFSFEDLEESDIAQWDYSELQDATENGEACWRITGRRVSDRRSLRDKNWLWIGKQKMTALRIEKFRGDRLAKRLSMSAFELKQEIWTAMSVEVADLSDRSVTTLQLTDARYDVRMSKSGFTLEALRGPW